MRGSYKDDRTSNHVDVFSIERGRKRTPGKERIKVSSIFVKDMTGKAGILWNTPFPEQVIGHNTLICLLLDAFLDIASFKPCHE